MYVPVFIVEVVVDVVVVVVDVVLSSHSAIEGAAGPDIERHDLSALSRR